MLASHDDVFQADMDLIREDRVLTDAATLRLARAVAGFGRSRNRDLPAHDLAAALFVLAAGLPAGARRREDEILSMVLDPRKGSAATLAAMKERAIGRAALPDATPGPRRLAEALAFGAFLAMAQAGAGFGEFRDAVVALVGRPDAAGFVQCRRRLAALAETYRRAHLVGAPTEPRVAALNRLVAQRPGPPPEDLAMTFFAQLVADGERPFFAGTTAAVLTALEAREEIDLRRTIDQARPLEDAAEAVVEEQPAGTEAGDMLSLVAGLPALPKLLTASERSRIADILRYAPWHRRLPLACLRAVAVGHWQMALVNTLKRSRGEADVAPLLEDPGALDYAGWLAGIDAAIARIVQVGAMHLALAPSDDGADARIRQARAQGLSLLKAERRAGFDRPRDEVSRSLADAAPALGVLHDELAAFRTALTKSLGGRTLEAVEDADAAVVAPLFSTLYRHRTGTPP